MISAWRENRKISDRAWETSQHHYPAFPLPLAEALECDPSCMQFWREHVHSAFIYAGNDPQSCQKLVRTLIADNSAVISKMRSGIGDVTVSGDFDEFCGVMAGIRLTANEADTDGNFVLNTTNALAFLNTT